MHKGMPSVGLNLLEIGKIAGIFQRIEIYYLMAALTNQTADEMGPDKSGPAGYEDSHLKTLSWFGYQDSWVRESYSLFAPVLATSKLA